MANIKGIIVEIGGDTSGLQNALKKVNSSTSSLSKELKGINSLLKLDPKNTELLSQKQTVLKQNIEQTSKKLEELRKAQEMADETIKNGGDISEENYRNLQREIINTESKLKQLKVEASKWTTAGRSIEEFGNKVTNISNKIDKMGTTLTTRLTLPIVGITTTAIASMDAVDEGLDTIATKTGATGSAAKELQQIYKEVASEVPGDFGDIGAAIGEINTRLDLTGDKLKTASIDFLKFAKVNGADVNTAVQLVTRAMGDAGIEADKYSELLDMLTVAGQKSGISIESLTTNLAKYGAPMRALGIDTKNAIAMFAGWEKAGVNTEIAFSGMKKAISNWGAAGKDSTKEFSKTLNEIAKCPTIAKATTKAIEVFGAKAGPDLADAIKGGRFEFEKYIEALDNGTGTIENTYGQIVDEVDDAQLAMQNAKIAMHDAGEVAAKSLGPILLDLAKQFKGLMERFDKLSDKEKKQILNMGLMVAAIGPAVKILGTLTKTAGTGIKTIGSFSQAVGLMGKTSTDAFNKASTGTQNLAKGLTFLTSPAGLATVAITAVAAGATYLALKQTEALRETNKLAEEISNSKQKYEEYNQSIDNTTKTNLAQIDSVSRLKDELKTLVDENGKVKEGNEGRVSFILNELNDALGTEYKLNDDIVQSYKNLQDEIDATIEKKRAEIKLEAYKQKYGNAMNTETDAVAKQKEVLDQLGMSYEEVREKYGDWIDKYNSSTLTTGDIDNLTQSEYNHRAELAKLSKAYEEQESVIKKCTEDKKNYESNYALFVEGKYNEIGKTITDTTKNWTNSTLKEIQDSIVQEQGELEKYKQIYEKTGSEVAQQQMQQAQQNLQNLANELIERTNTIGTLGIDEVSAWKTLANNSYEEYKNALAKVGPTTQQEIQKATGIIVSDTGLETASADKAYNMTTNFDNKLKLGDRTKAEISNTATAINNDTSVESAATVLGQDVDTNFNNKLDGWTWGWDLVKNIYNGLTNQESKSLISKGASAIGSIIDSFLGFSLPEKGPLSDFDKSMPDMIDLMSKGINTNKSKVINSAEKLAQELYNTLNNDMKFPVVRDFGKLQGSLSREITNNTSTVNNTNKVILQIYPQHLTEAELDRTFNYINKKFGSAY